VCVCVGVCVCVCVCVCGCSSESLHWVSRHVEECSQFFFRSSLQTSPAAVASSVGPLSPPNFFRSGGEIFKMTKMPF